MGSYFALRPSIWIFGQLSPGSRMDIHVKPSCKEHETVYEATYLFNVLSFDFALLLSQIMM